ncbi:RtcB family protein [Mycobacteroides abscessus]|uniref:RtcB family protein n=1 Tax=Mycobacteroides abscessus TaxID=36809 RepID=UPI0010426D41|nr:RtcB family protein [Mycobacteroides abscessus]
MSTQFPVTMRGADNVALWAYEHEIEPAALNQLRNISALGPVATVAVMPDVHLGKGATVGSVIAMRDAVSPSAVGVDIGCGVCGVRTSLSAHDLPDDLSGLRSAVEAAIPVGFNSHERAVNVQRLGLRTADHDRLWQSAKAIHANVDPFSGRAPRQLGTLGGGNHFLEVCLDGEDRVWLTLHSGSRNVGKELAERHITVAKGLPHNADLPDRDLAFFYANTPEMDAYLYDLTWAQQYAALSRQVMMALFRTVLSEAFAGVRFTDEINVHHNYVRRETVGGEEFIVTRKGAIRAGSDELALIPGSMGTGSYVVRGLGNPESLFSASHGAGRKMSRSAAKRTFTVEDLAEQTAGIECRKDAGVVDEIPGAYKDIHGVIAAQDNLVAVVAHLRTILCVKG